MSRCSRVCRKWCICLRWLRLRSSSWCQVYVYLVAIRLQHWKLTRNRTPFPSFCVIRSVPASFRSMTWTWLVPPGLTRPLPLQSRSARRAAQHGHDRGSMCVMQGFQSCPNRPSPWWLLKDLTARGLLSDFADPRWNTLLLHSAVLIDGTTWTWFFFFLAWSELPAPCRQGTGLANMPSPPKVWEHAQTSWHDMIHVMRLRYERSSVSIISFSSNATWSPPRRLPLTTGHSMGLPSPHDQWQTLRSMDHVIEMPELNHFNTPIPFSPPVSFFLFFFS